jgi:hypothetical protein
VPVGAYHEFFGFLHQSRGTLALSTPDGRRWRVSAPFSAARYVEHDVRVRGIRRPGATLDVDAIELAKRGRLAWR